MSVSCWFANGCVDALHGNPSPKDRHVLEIGIVRVSDECAGQSMAGVGDCPSFVGQSPIVPSAQKMNRRLNWMSRWPNFVVMRPKFALLGSAYPKLPAS
jgi:hypothetical protein